MTELIIEQRGVFEAYHERTQRWAIMVAHRRCGKTVACVQDLIMRALQCPYPHGRYAYIAPLYSQGKEIAWDYLRRFAEPVMVDANVAELHVTLQTGARIRIHGADNPDRLRGGYLDGAILDEYADMRPSVLGTVIRPMLADRGGWLTLIGTPKGRNDFHKWWEHAQSDTSWYTSMLRASETGLVNEGELRDAQRQMTPEEYAQEFECSFDASILGAYYGKLIAESEREGRVCQVPVVPGVGTQTAWDLGIGDSTAIWVFQCVGSEIRVLDCIQNSGQGLEWYVRELEGRGWGKSDVKHWLPHDAKVRELTSGRSRVEFLSELGLKVDLVPNLGLDDGINAARIMLPQCWFDIEKTSEGIEALRQYRTQYDERTKAFSNKPRHDWTSHYADAFRYMCIAARHLRGPMENKPIPFPGVPLNRMTMDQFHDLQDPHIRERI